MVCEYPLFTCTRSNKAIPKIIFIFPHSHGFGTLENPCIWNMYRLYHIDKDESKWLLGIEGSIFFFLNYSA